MFVVCKYMLFGGWMVVGWYILRAGTVALMRERKGELEGEAEEIFICTYIYLR